MTGTVALTGGLGYLGGRAAGYLTEHGYRVRLLTRRDHRYRPEWSSTMRVRQADLSDVESLRAAFRGVDAVIHLAALNAQACAANPADAKRINVDGTRNVVRALEAENVPRLIYMSTAHVYANPLAGELDEDSETTNTHPYAATHRAAEEIVLQPAGLTSIVLRLSNGVGSPADVDADCWALVCNNLCRQIAETGRMVLRGTGRDLRDFIAVSEVSRALHHFLVASEENRSSDLFNLASGAATSTLGLAQFIAARAKAVLGKEVTVETAPDDGLRPAVLALSTSRLVANGFYVQGDLAPEIDATLRFCRDHFCHA